MPSMQTNWQSTAIPNALKARANLLSCIRQFFSDRQVLEVETPLLCNSTVPDPYIESFRIDNHYLQTSPEFAMKRLLASGSGDIYQICKAFRHEEVGKRHNPEFTMLEWYRIGFDHHDLMAELNALLQTTLNTQPAEKISYQQLFETHLNLNPHQATLIELCTIAKQHQLDIQLEKKDDWLNLLLTHLIEPKIGLEKPLFIYDYPTSQSALAKIREGNPPVAERFELYYKGYELANGFHELNQSDRQTERFREDLQKRKQAGQHCPPIDERFLQSLDYLPSCAGVAVGIDRLLMIKSEQPHIASVLSFDFQNA